LHRILHPVLRAYLRAVRPSFQLGGRPYDYFWHPYNMTWRNERCVEVAIARGLLARAGNGRVLEVGNVLSHYFPVTHAVVDKYERAPGVRNEDVVAIAPEHPYDLIIAISTIEHVGWDETPRDPGKALRALDHLRACLAPAGRMLVTMPVGYHPEVDRAAAGGRLPFDRIHFMQRCSRFMDWREVRWADVATARYDAPHPFANAILVGFCDAA
jgi:hypothetical protein